MTLRIKKDLATRVLLDQLGPIQPKVTKQAQRSRTTTVQTPTPMPVCVALSGHGIVTNSLIIPVYVFRKSHPKLKVKVNALLDDASHTTFIKTDVKDKLGIPGVSSKLILSTMLGREEITISRVDGLVVERIDQRVQVELPRTYSRDQIPSRRDQIPSPEVAAVWPHLQRIKDNIMPYQEG